MEIFKDVKGYEGYYEVSNRKIKGNPSKFQWGNAVLNTDSKESVSV